MTSHLLPPPAASQDTYAYAEEMHTAIKLARIPHMFVRAKLDLYLAADMDVERCAQQKLRLTVCVSMA